MSPSKRSDLEDWARLREEVESQPLARSLGQFLDEAAAREPDKVFLHFFQQDEKYTYREISEQSDRLASSLCGLGVRKGAHVALMIPNGPAFIVSWFALAKIGAVMVPVNFSYTSSELAYILSNSDSEFLVIDESLAAIFDGIPAETRTVADENVVVVGAAVAPRHGYRVLVDAGSAPFRAPSAVEQADLLSIQYTSGTTGLPKGCMQSHRFWLIASLVASRGHGMEVTNILVTFPLFYLDPQLQVLTALHGGGTAFIARQHSLKAFVGWIKEFKIHLATITPPVYHAIPARPDDAENDLRFIAAFYHKEDTHQALEERFGAVARDAFGMTEVGVATFTPTSATHMVGSGTCGLAAPFREVRVCDEEGKEMPWGETGELCIAGDGILWGYYRRPEANANSFRGRWFRTGDLAQMDADGYVWIVGRMKDMIKRSGENIAAVEVEGALAEHPDILEAAVIPVPDKLRKEEVKAYLILQPGKTAADLSPDQVAIHCESRLARFKIPRFIAYVDEFPRTPSNKVAKSKLVDAADDLRTGAYDRLDEVWR
ncbi:MAG: class I adenylate-forming enzyme family protein [Myxococcota bacterium]|nr:class I adenylate-forming enzyme family protein [Myxococcota bacterium]